MQHHNPKSSNFYSCNFALQLLVIGLKSQLSPINGINSSLSTIIHHRTHISLLHKTLEIPLHNF